MKKLLSVAILFSSAFAWAQGESTSKDAKRLVAFGLKFGMNRSNVFDSHGQDFVASPKNGLAGGAFVSLPIGGLLGVQPELLLSQKGFSGTGTLLGQDYAMKRTSAYLDVPVQL